jgi:hypothetical protein
MACSATFLTQCIDERVVVKLGNKKTAHMLVNPCSVIVIALIIVAR